MSLELVQTVILVLSFVAALIAIAYHRGTAKKQATLDVINKYIADDKIGKGIDIVKKYDEETKPETYLKEGSEAREYFLYLMNFYDAIGIGLDNDIYDERMTADAFKYDVNEFFIKKGKLGCKMTRLHKFFGDDNFSKLHILIKLIEGTNKNKE